MERHIDQAFENVRQGMLRMGAEAEDMVATAITALLERESDKAEALPERDKAVDDLEKKIDEECYTIMALQQPTAGDLRFLIAITRIVQELERIADQTKNIGKSVLVLNQEPPLKPYIDIPRMAEIVRSMLSDGLDSFTSSDNQLALDVCQRDNEVDALWKQLFRELLSFMLEDPKNVQRSLHILFVAHSLERIADHATNIAEVVIYYLEARDIRHTPEGTGAPA